MTEGEAGLVAAFSILTLLALIGAAEAEDTAFAFHAYLAAAASIAVGSASSTATSTGRRRRSKAGRTNHFRPAKLALIFLHIWAGPHHLRYTDDDAPAARQNDSGTRQ
jgi:hypothetical protein